MTEQEARKIVEDRVYVYFVLDDIIYGCQSRGIPTRTKSGKMKSRGILERKLIDAMVKEMTNEGGKENGRNC